MPIISYIIKGWDDHAEGKFFILTDVILILKIGLLFIRQLGVSIEVLLFYVFPTSCLDNFSNAYTFNL